jgi:biotin synthase
MNKLLEKLKKGDVNKKDLIQLLKTKGKLQEDLFKEARKTREKYLKDIVSVRGVIEVSNECRKNCDYCAMRHSNKKLARFRLDKWDIISSINKIKRMGIRTIFIQSGEDVIIDNLIKEIIPKIKRTDKKIILCVGNRTKKEYEGFKKIGINGYILKFETSNTDLFKKIRHEDFSKRIGCINWLKELKFTVGTGNIIGIPGQTLESIAEDILLGIKLKPDMVSVAPFIPNENTPFKNKKYGDINLTLNAMAIWRILLKKAYIPTVSALEKIKKNGQLAGFNAGANVITINFTPKKKQKCYNIYSKNRFIVESDYAFNLIKKAGLKPDFI